MSVSYWMLLIVGVFMSAFGGICLKIGAGQINYTHGLVHAGMEMATNYNLFFGIVLYAVPVFIWIYMLKSIQISFLQPLFSLIYVLTPILALLVLHESIPLIRWFGMAVIIFGVYLIAS